MDRSESIKGCDPKPIQEICNCDVDLKEPLIQADESNLEDMGFEMLDLPPKFYFPRRYVLVVLLFLGLVLAYGLRVCISIAAAPVSPHLTDSQTANPIESSSIFNLPSDISMYNEFGWNDTQKGIVLSAFFYGYVSTQIIGGLLAKAFGGKPILFWGLFLASVCTFITPAVAHNFPLLITFRVLTGVFEGVTYPSIMTMLGPWTHPRERSRFVSAIFAGAYIGNVITLFAAGALMQRFGWRIIFLIYGAAGALWAAAFLALAASSPDTHTSIHLSERRYLARGAALASTNPNTHDHDHPPATHAHTGKGRGGGAGGGGKGEDRGAAHTHQECCGHGKESGRGGDTGGEGSGGATGGTAVPWGQILSCRAAWAIFAGHAANNWGFYLLLTELPSYLSTVHGLDLEAAGAVAALPYLAQFMVSVMGGALADAAIARGGTRLAATRTRKVCMAIGLLVPAVALVGVSHVTSAAPAAALLVLAVGASGLCNAGFGANYMEISGSFAGVILALGNTLATVPGMIAPTLTGVITDAYGCGKSAAPGGASGGGPGACEEAYGLVFWIAFWVYAAGTAVYVALATAERVLP